MSPRARLATGILIIWAATLGWHVKRLYFRSEVEIVAEAARTIPPGTAYYRVYQGDRRVGWAQSQVDTLPSASGFVMRDRLDVSFDALGQAVSTSVRSQATLGPTLALREFHLESAGAVGERSLHGIVRGDTLLELTLGEGEGADTLYRALDSPLLLSGAWPLRFIAGGEMSPGDRFSLRLFDPLATANRAVELEVLARETRTFPDSVTDEGPLWVTAREDTVDAWLVRQTFSGLELRSWVDEDGRVLETETAAGLRLERTAFELAFYGDSVPRAGRRGTPTP